MALLMHGRLRVTTSANVVINGGKARIKNAGTSTLSTVYSDVGLTTPLTNPVVADSDGWCPQVFAAEGLAVDVDYETAAGVVVKQDEDLVFLGTAGTSFSRDFGSGGRAQIRGASGIVYYEAGPPVGDNTGGTLVLSGWAGTTADEIEANGPTNIASDTFTVNDKKLPGVVQTAATTFTAATNVDIALTNSPSGVRAWEVLVWDLALSAAERISARLSYDSGVSYKSGAADYGYAVTNLIKAAGSSHTINGGTTDMSLTIDEQLAAASAGIIRLYIVTPNSGNGFTNVSSRIEGRNQTTSAPGLWLSSAQGLGNYGRATHVRLFSTGGGATLTGKYRVTALRGTGDA